MASCSSLTSLLATILLFAIVISPTIMSPCEAARMPSRDILQLHLPPRCPTCVCCSPPPSPGSCCPCNCGTPPGPISAATQANSSP